jgi:CPA2 family monovalent cation:H+ antiporter-2
MAPFRAVFAAMFFVSVGMLFNPSFVVTHPLMVLAALGVVLVAKPLVAVAIVMLLRETRRTATTVGVGLAQIGEFSFILVALGIALGLLTPESQSLVVAGALLSITLNPLVFKAVGRWAPKAEAPLP